MLDSLACLLVKVLSALLCAMPARLAIRLGGWLGLLAFRLQLKRTRTGVFNLLAAFPGKFSVYQARRIIRQAYKHFGEGVFELMRLPVIDRAYINRHIAVEGMHHFESAIASGRPVIVLTGHYGSWEMCSIGSALIGHPIVALAREQIKMPKLYRLLVSYRESKGCTVVHKGGAMRRLISALDNRQVVGIVGDQANRQGIFVPFFGRLTLFAKGPFELAYSKKALIVPGFIRRVHGPNHRFVIEPTMDLAASSSLESAVEQGTRQFAALLSKHIQEEPSQWLWMHKRWKFTPNRRVVILSDGKTGHVKQSQAAVKAFEDGRHFIESKVVEVRFRSRFSRAAALLWSRLAPKGWAAAWCLQQTLTEESAKQLLSHYADIIVSCGSAALPAAVLAAGLFRAKSVALMNPAPFPLKRFDLVIAPVHDRLPSRQNVVAITGAMVDASKPEFLAESAQQLMHHPKFRRSASAAHLPVVALLLGGDTDAFMMTQAWTQALIDQILQACTLTGAECVATTSRRTPRQSEAMLEEQLMASSACRLLLLASSDSLEGTMPGLLGLADVVVVSGESVSMITESCASQRPVVVVEVPLRPKGKATKHFRFAEALNKDLGVPVVAVGQVSDAIVHALKNPQTTPCLDNTAIVRPALARLL